MIKSYCSPRSSARRTVEILGLGVHNHQDFFNRETQSTSSTQLKDESLESNIQLTPWLKEWDYGEYEGKTRLDIHSLRMKQGMSEECAAWNIWTDGCPGGEYVSLSLSFFLGFIIIIVIQICLSLLGGGRQC
jgi:probable phosphoglycerate mutase